LDDPLTVAGKHLALDACAWDAAPPVPYILREMHCPQDR
jgi:hypothetical protein